MIFTHDTEVSLAEAAALVNTVDSDGVDGLAQPAGLRRFLDRHPFTGVILGTEAEVAEVREVRSQLGRLWQVADRDAAVPIINEILAACDARPFLTRHDEWDWHLHVTPPEAPLAQRMAAEAAMAFLELIRADDWARLKTCAADDCHDVLVDLSKNRSKRFCDDGNCGNRAAVAAYRARKRADERTDRRLAAVRRAAVRGDDGAPAGRGGSRRRARGDLAVCRRAVPGRAVRRPPSAGGADDRPDPARLQRDLRHLTSLRQAIAGHYRRWYDLDVPIDQIAVTTGSSGAFLVSFLAAFDAGDRVLLARPGYPAYRNILSSLGCEVVELPCGPAERFQPTRELLDAALRDGPVAGLVLASPANPTGTMVDHDQLADLAGWCRDHGVRLVSDEIYHGIVDASLPSGSASAAAPGSTIVRRWSSPRSPSTRG